MWASENINGPDWSLFLSSKLCSASVSCDDLLTQPAGYAKSAASLLCSLHEISVLYSCLVAGQDKTTIPHLRQ